jgi:hypothetical protein
MYCGPSCPLIIKDTEKNSAAKLQKDKKRIVTATKVIE